MKKRFDKSIAFRTRLIISLFLAVIFIAVLGISCQSQTPASAPSQGLPKEPTLTESPAAPHQIEVAIEGFAFKPDIVNIQVGTKVIWHNNDSVIHTVTARDKSFDSGNLRDGDTFSYTFQEKGIFEYYCIPHPYMTGEITVE